MKFVHKLLAAARQQPITHAALDKGQWAWPGLLTAATVASALSLSGAIERRQDLPPTQVMPPTPWTLATVDAADDAACQLAVHTNDGAQVSLLRVDEHGTQQSWQQTAHSGEARFSDLPFGSFQVVVSHHEVLQGAPTFHCNDAGTRGFLEVDVGQATSTVTFAVVDERGAPVPNAEVAITQTDRTRHGLHGVIRVRANDDGVAHAALPITRDPSDKPAQLEVLGLASDHMGRSHVVVLDDEHVHVQLKMATTPTIRGTVVDEHGQPLPHARVSLSGVHDPRVRAPSTHTDEHGRFALSVPQGANVSLVAQHDVGVVRLAMGSVDMASVTALQNVALQVRDGRSVQGVLLDANNQRLAYAHVRYRVRAQGVEGLVMTDANGQFVIAGMPMDQDVEAWSAAGVTGAWAMQVAPGGQRHPAALTLRHLDKPY
jgi:protocatechuate 3,4-dioxygenase beta subunit